MKHRVSIIKLYICIEEGHYVCSIYVKTILLVNYICKAYGRNLKHTIPHANFITVNMFSSF